MVPKFLHEHRQTIHLKDADIAKLPDFVGVQQLHSSCTFIEVLREKIGLTTLLVALHASRKRCMSQKVQSVTEGGAAAGVTALVKEKPSSYVGAQDKGL